jgi:hypothetical protein
MSQFSPACVCVCNSEAESCPLHTPVERVQMLVGRPALQLGLWPYWQEVTMAPGYAPVFQEPLPDVYVVRGSQMFKLVWPELPPVDASKTPMR